MFLPLTPSIITEMSEESGLWISDYSHILKE